MADPTLKGPSQHPPDHPEYQPLRTRFTQRESPVVSRLRFCAYFLICAKKVMRLRVEYSERPSGNFETAAELVTKTAASARLLCLRHRTSTQTLFQWRQSLLLRAIP